MWSWPWSLSGTISLYRRDSSVDVRWCEWSLLALLCCSYFVTCHYSELQSNMTDGPCSLNAGSPRCSKHGRPCALRVVRKGGENKGRHFYACPLPREAQCGFFEVCVWFIKLDYVIENLGPLKCSKYLSFSCFIFKFKSYTGGVKIQRCSSPKEKLIKWQLFHY